ncbi:MAG TPA: orotidine 5'-phosphate decarboxylase, partial [Limnochordia bacterium]
GASGYRAVGAVVGATQPAACAALRRVLPHSWFLLPGYGTQGAGWEDVVGAFNGDGWGALISASRTLARAYRTPPWDGRGEAGFAWAAAQAAEAMRLSLAKAARAARKGS